MAFYDWNHNGKKDIQDDWLEYNIYQESTKNSGGTSSGGSAGSGSCLGIVIVILIVLSLLGQCSA